MGEHPSPSCAVTPWRSTPRTERSAEPAAESDYRRSHGQRLAPPGEKELGDGTYALEAVAALHGSGAAAVGGGRKECEGEGGDDGKAGEHGVEEECERLGECWLVLGRGGRGKDEGECASTSANASTAADPLSQVGGLIYAQGWPVRCCGSSSLGRAFVCKLSM